MTIGRVFLSRPLSVTYSVRMSVTHVPSIRNNSVRINIPSGNIIRLKIQRFHNLIGIHGLKPLEYHHTYNTDDSDIIF